MSHTFIMTKPSQHILFNFIHYMFFHNTFFTRSRGKGEKKRGVFNGLALSSNSFRQIVVELITFVVFAVY
jgi:hypothetical protein